MMGLTNAVKVYDLAVEVVQHFHFGCFLFEKHLGSACECFHIGCVLRKYFNDLLGETVFASYV